jgi:hypothetical protein
MSKRELPKVKRCVSLPRIVAETGDATKNLSEWLGQAGLEKIENDAKKAAAEERAKKKAG